MRSERFRLARELHDTLAQSVAAIAMQLEAAESLAEQAADAAKIRRNVTRALVLARDTLEQARRAVLDLRAEPLRAGGLFGAVDALAAAWRKHNSAALSLRKRGDATRLSPRVEEGLYRIASEALANAARHAVARKVELALAVKALEVQLTIRDDGTGFDPRAIAPDRFGLMGMRERTKLLGGSFELRTEANAGTEIRVSLPLS